MIRIGFKDLLGGLKPKKRRFGGRTYSRQGIWNTKKEANASAREIREVWGDLARVVKENGGWAVYIKAK